MHEAFIKSQYLNYIEGKKQQTMDTKFFIITSTTHEALIKEDKEDKS